MQRFYSSSGAAYEVYVYSGDSMLGPNWFCPYETHLEADDFDEFDEPINYILVDGDGQFHHLESGSGYSGWRARLDQGSPFTLTKTGSGNSASYVLKGSGYREWGFNADGKLTYYEANTNTTQQERLTFTYDGSDRLWKVAAPGSDGRYLEFLYNNGTFTRRCTSVKLVAGSNNYALIEYTYDGSGRLAAVKKNPTYASSTHEVQTLYDYGSFDLVSGSESWTSGSFLGKVSYRVNQESSPYRPLVAYKYRTGFDAPFVSKEFVYDVGVTPSIWKQTLTLELYAWDHTTTIYYGDDTSDPPTYFVTDYKCDVADMTYGSNTPKMPPTHFFGADDTGAGGSGGVDKARLFGSVKLQGSSWYSLWEADYDLTNSDYMLKYRRTKTRTYSTSDSGSSMETSNAFNSTFKESVSSVENPEGEITSYAYGVLYYIPATAIVDYGCGQLAQVTSADGRATRYTYHLASSGYPVGLLATVEDHYGNVTSYEYDSRGNATEVTYPDGNVVTRTFNDFGQVLTETRTHLGARTYTYSDEIYLSDGTTAIPSAEKSLPPRLVEVEDADGNRTRYFYTEEGYTWKVTNANGKTMENSYDRRGRLKEVENADGDVVKFTYDIYDRMTKFTDGRNKETAYEYDQYGRVSKETDPDGYYKEYVFSDETASGGGCGCGGGGANKVSRIRQEDGNFIYFSYDLAGRIEKVWYSSDAGLDRTAVSPQLTYTYDKVNRVLSIQDTRLTTSGNTYGFTYDTGDIGRLEVITHPEGYTQEYIYQDDDQEDHFRRVIAYRDVDGHIMTYDYDALERLATLTDGYSADTVYTYATTSDTIYPVGAVKRTAYGNGAKNDYTYDSLGRFDKVEYLDASSSVFDYVDLAYDPAGMITEKKRKDGASHFTTFYTYDDAYRLVGELTKNGSGVEKTMRAYGYDDAGNRTSMAFDNDSITTMSTTYAYGDRNQIVSNTGYYRDGTTDTGSMSYTWDAKGNILTRTGSTYEWNEDNRLVKAYVSGGDPKAELFQKFFKYDSAGRRILEYKNTTSARTRHFFNGLTEEIKKVSVGTHADTSFARTVQLTSASGELSGWRNAHASHVSDADRFSTVTESYGEELAGTAYWETGTGWNITGKRTFAVWAKATADGAWVCICVKSTDNNYYGLVYQGTTGADYNTGNGGVIRVGGTAQDFTNGEWVRLERDLQADLTARFGKTLSCVTGIYLWSGGLTTPKMWIDDLSFSNSLTVEHNTLGGGKVGCILRNRSTNPATYAAMDRWFHYDQVGSVMAESDATGALAQVHYQDAFGNSQASWSTGLWGGDKPGWHHNTKEYDGDIGLVYMYSRWYSAEVGRFTSRAPMPREAEHPYSFGVQQPVGLVDPTGRYTNGCCNNAAVKTKMPSEDLLDKILHEEVDDISIIQCVYKLLRGPTNVICINSDICNRSPDWIYGYAAEGNVYLCDGAFQGCDKIDLARIIVHEMIHLCGHDHNEGEGPWPGKGGKYDCADP